MQQLIFPKPHCLILYVGRLKQIFEEAGNPLRSVTAIDCWSLNRRPPHHLYKRNVNLLDFVGEPSPPACSRHQHLPSPLLFACRFRTTSVSTAGKYEVFGVSGARHGPNDPRKWIWQDEEGPQCKDEWMKQRGPPLGVASAQNRLSAPCLALSGGNPTAAPASLLWLPLGLRPAGPWIL